MQTGPAPAKPAGLWSVTRPSRPCDHKMLGKPRNMGRMGETPMSLTGMAETFHGNWVTQVRKGVLELCVMRALAGGATYAYEIGARLGEMPGLAVRATIVSLILQRLRQAGLVRPSARPSQGGPPRRRFALTPRGRGELRRMDAHLKLVVAGADALKARPKR